MKKILFVGDLRKAGNYGAIATTEALLDLILSVSDSSNLRIIDYRSFSGKTPIAGFNEKSKKQKIKEILKKTSLSKVLLKRKKNHIFSTVIPGRFEDYNNAVKLVRDGKVLQYEKNLIQWADVIIVNSEGNIVNGTDSQGWYREGGRYVLFISYLSKFVYAKECYIINHTVDPRNRDIIKIIKVLYPKLNGVFIRERLSLQLLKKWGVNNAEYVPDALWSHAFEYDKFVKPPKVLEEYDYNTKYICIGDSSGILNRYNRVKWNVKETFVKLINETKKLGYDVIFIDGFGGGNEDINKAIKMTKIKSVNISNCNYHELYFVLKHAALFMSGRWHASIISIMANTPILLWGSDSHKTEALYNEIDYHYEFFDIDTLPLNIDRIVKVANKIIEDAPDFCNILQEKNEYAKKNSKMLIEENI